MTVLEHFVNSNKEALIRIYNTEKDKLETKSVLLINYEKIDDIKVTIGTIDSLDKPIQEKITEIKKDHESDDDTNIYAVCVDDKKNVNVVLMK